MKQFEGQRKVQSNQHNERVPQRFVDLMRRFFDRGTGGQPPGNNTAETNTNKTAEKIPRIMRSPFFERS